MKKQLLLLTLFFGLLNSHFNKAENEKLKIYAICTPSHYILRDEWFLKTLQDDYEIVIVEHKQECPSAQFMHQGWKSTTIHKVELWIDAVRDNWGNIFVCSDVDIQFFQPTEPILLELIKDKDMVIQRDTPKGGLCSGFFACRANEKTLQLFQAMLEFMKHSKDKSDQNSMNYFLKSNNKFNIVWDYLPVEFFGGGTLTGHGWKPGQKLPVPSNIVMHHANYTAGIKNKIKQLNYVSQIANQKKNGA